MTDRTDHLEFTAPLGGAVSGGAYLVEDVLLIAEGSAPAGARVRGRVSGVFTLPKAPGEPWTEGQKLYWDDTNKRLTTAAATGRRLVGAAARAAGPDDTVGEARLDGAVREPEP